MVRFAQPGKADIAQAKKIWQACFGDSDAFLDWYFSGNYAPEDTLFYEEDGQIASHLQMRDYTLYVNGKALHTCYLAGIATYPAFRKRGYVRALIEAAFAEQRRRGTDSCFLVPTTFPFYEQFGFAACYDKMLCTLPSFWRPVGESRTFFPLTDDMGTLLEPAYRYALSGSQGYTLRSAEKWRLFLQDAIRSGRMLCRGFAHGKECGYLIARETDQTRTLFVTELGYSSAAARRAVWKEIARLGTAYQKTQVLLPVGDKTYLEFCNARESRSVQPYAMARILNVPAALGRCADSFTGRAVLRIQDNMIEENNGIFLVENGKAVPSATEKADAETDTATLTQLFWGYLTVQEAQQLGRLSGDSGKLEGLFHEGKNYLDNAILAF